MATIQLSRAPTFSQVRSVAGAVVADPLVVNDTNYPTASGFDPGSRIARIVLYWGATGMVAGLDFLDIQILIRDGINSAWLGGPKALGLFAGEMAELDVSGSSLVYARVITVNAAAATGLSIWAAAAAHRS